MITKLFLILLLLILTCLSIINSYLYYIRYKKNKLARIEAITSGAKNEMKDYGTYIEELVYYKINELNGVSSILQNVNVDHNGYRCEFDTIFFHNQNMFAVEVKGYTGELYKGDHGEIIQSTQSGVKTVRNPYSQIRRSIGILKRMLSAHNIKIWIDELIIIPTEATVEKEIEDTTELIRTFDDLARVVYNKPKGRVTPHLEKSICNILQ